MADNFHQYVFARRVFAYPWQHVVALDFRQQCGGCAGALSVFAVVSVLGVVAALSHVLFNWASPIPVVGASGAIAGVMGAYLLLFPHARIDCLLIFVFLTFVEVPAIFFLVFWFVSQFLVYQPGVAYLAHIGGFVAGIITIKLMGVRTAFFMGAGDTTSEGLSPAKLRSICR